MNRCRRNGDNLTLGAASVSITNYWTSDHHRFVIDLNGDGHADVVGVGPDCVWSSVNQGAMGFDEPPFAVVAFEANAGWRVDKHPRMVTDLTGAGRADIIGFGDDGVWVSLGNDGAFQPTHFVLQNLGFNQGWRLDSHPPSELPLSPARTNSIRACGHGRAARSW
jgi:hypothetical protein